MSDDSEAANRRYEDWPVEDDYQEATYVGHVEGGGAWFYSEADGTLLERAVDRDDRRLLPASDEREVPPDESLGRAVERLGDDLGWESLSAFAREHLESDE